MLTFDSTVSVLRRIFDFHCNAAQAPSRIVSLFIYPYYILKSSWSKINDHFILAQKKGDHPCTLSSKKPQTYAYGLQTTSSAEKETPLSSSPWWLL